MKLLKQAETFSVYDAGAAKCVVFKDARKHLVYRKADAAKPEYAEYEMNCAPGDKPV